MARAYWIVEPGVSEIRDEELRAPSAGEVLVETHFSGISRGTEALVYRGEVPVSEYDRMRAPFQVGGFPGPLKYGYANVGRVLQGPAGLLGKFVFCLFPHQSAYVVPEAAVLPLPPDLPPARAVLAANMETAVNALWDAPPLIGDKVVVVGAGTLGCLVAYLASRIPGVRVTLVDIEPSKSAVAAALGIEFRAPETTYAEADLVVHASASASGLATALEQAKFEGRVLELSWFGNRVVGLPLGQSFHSRRLTLQSSQVGTVSPNKPGVTHRERLSLSLALLDSEALDVLVSGESKFEDLPQVMAELAGSSSGLCHRIRYHS